MVYTVSKKLSKIFSNLGLQVLFQLQYFLIILLLKHERYKKKVAHNLTILSEVLRIRGSLSSMTSLTLSNSPLGVVLAKDFQRLEAFSAL